MKLNKSQLSAVSCKDGPAIVLAGPGSGKTAVITRRTYELIKSGVPPENILVITFTRAAASEMRARFVKLFMAGEPPVTFGTFHSVFFSILAHEVNLNSNNITSDSTRYRILKDILQKDSNKSDNENDLIAALLDEIGSVKSHGGLTASYRAASVSTREFAFIYKSYQRELARLRLIDFDDMLLLTKRLFEKRPGVLRAWRERYKYIMVDEFQDVNSVQYDIVRMLAAPSNNLFIVGDDDQSIYGFRGSSPGIMLQFPRDFARTKKIFLDVNYRSTSEIVETACKVIANNKSRYDKNLTAFAGSGYPPELHAFKSASQENEYILKRIKDYHEGGISYNEMGVLYRTNRTYRGLAELLTKNDIPFVTESKIINIYEHPMSEDIFAYLRIIAGGRARNDFIKIINRPVRYIKRELFKDEIIDLRRIASSPQLNLSQKKSIEKLWMGLNYAGKLSPFSAINFIRRGIGYESYMKEYARSHGEDIEELSGILDELADSSKGFKTIGDWFCWVDEYKSFLKESNPNPADAVTLSSMHKSKGLEYEVVFVPSVNERLVPHKKAKLDSEIEEERRLFYVALTRAKRHLIVSYTNKRYGKKMTKSRFIDEMGLDEESHLE